MKLSNRGFAISTIIYSILILFVVVAFSILAVLKYNYEIEKDYKSDIEENLNICYEKGEC